VLREVLQRLDDFADVEAEEQAFAMAEQHPFSLSRPAGPGSPVLRGAGVEQWFANLLPATVRLSCWLVRHPDVRRQ
jgi:hypothetical protein